MEYFLNSVLLDQRLVLLNYLKKTYNINNNCNNDSIILEKKTFIDDSRCKARIWDHPSAKIGHYNTRCTRKSLKDSCFCRTHGKEISKDKQLCMACYKFSKDNIFHKFAWEHLGRCDELPPSFYFKITEQSKICRLKKKCINSDSEEDVDGDEISEPPESNIESDKDTRNLL